MNKYNAEGYYDPTAYEALSAVEKEAKKKPYPSAGVHLLPACGRYRKES
jgi:hypothetical protein